MMKSKIMRHEGARGLGLGALEGDEKVDVCITKRLTCAWTVMWTVG